MMSFFPGGVLDEILNLIEPVSEGFPSYSCRHCRHTKSKLVKPRLFMLYILVCVLSIKKHYL